ncbi:organoarsenical effux MFS transporter ArsJ [Photobacterium damselae]|uniref:Organoarsenical effux MFS transporter ArsJ n=1 Tax=Photobacterium damselae subsp. damselae TaxID=85581 RepID=A0AAD3WTB3_PHODD|nr:organoarsenical effux MFS transporter ArsJ [Photobacterium damselae]KAB1177520.1 organoarsenical effux MFS transporter ArsJ [Photobacterium damselae subsp. damselae]MCG3816282.1 organoarsenical effux MFS transporter ArsJ [Photobacterium damselae]NVO74315.1 organoarsenical effux MFS transporter ArsJ [Photobacterium damselae subsp. damselae]PSB76763.1 MFS transporter [Photobacterium damselae subsp. damselae]QSH56269.1 organoarsenical effux MFS transporter ArsJ [Photobacterium damselae subsp. 
MFSTIPANVRQYMLVTFNYWNFTVTDGALRMLVVLYFHQLGYSPLEIASLFLFYEFFGVITNLIGGWLGAKLGLNRTMNIGLALQIIALSMLAVPTDMLTVIWVMLAQAISGIAKDLNKMSAKSAIKTLVPSGEKGALYKWIAILTGSKNALKGAGFFLGGFLLSWLGFSGAVIAMAGVLLAVFILSLCYLKGDLGKAKQKVKFSQIFSKSPSVNILSAARMFLFGARDVWFVIALPIYLGQVFGWDHLWVGGFLALWIIGYGIVQTFAPKVTGKAQGKTPDGRAAMGWAGLLATVTALIALLVTFNLSPQITIVLGLMIFGAIFAVNSSLHSYLIVSYAKEDGVSLDVGFYYMANAMGRLMGTLLSGWVYQTQGFVACLWVSVVFLVLTTIISVWLPKQSVSTSHTSIS